MAKLGPYAELIRLNKALGYCLNSCPYFVGLAYSTLLSPTPISSTVLLERFVVLTCWSVLLRWGGCAWNDIVDQDLDRQITRTRSRPLPRGAVKTSNAVLFTTAIFLCASLLLFLLPRPCMIEAVIIVLFGLLYPFGKQLINYPQLILTNIAWAVPMTMRSVEVDPLDHILPTTCLFLFIGTLIVMLDVLYACQDIEEDMKAGVKSMAVHFRHAINPLIYSLFLGSMGLLVAVGVFAGFGFPFFLLSVGGHFFSFRFFLVALNQKPSPSVERHAKLAVCSAISLLILGLVVENQISPATGRS